MFFLFLFGFFFFKLICCCPPNAIEGLTPDDCYIFSTSLPSEQQNMSFIPALENCANYYGTLTSIASAFEASLIMAKAHEFFGTNPSQYFWTSGVAALQKLYPNQPIFWIWDGWWDNFTYTAWAPGQPQTQPYPGCVPDLDDDAVTAVMKVSVQDGRWYR